MTDSTKNLPKVELNVDLERYLALNPLSDEIIKDTGMTEVDAKTIRSSSVANNQIRMFRPINPASSELLRQGSTGKLFATKGKSSIIGPIEGVVPYRAEFSKVGTNVDSAKDEIDKFQIKNDSDINDSNVRFFKIVFAQILKNVAEDSVSKQGIEEYLKDNFSDHDLMQQLGSNPQDFNKELQNKVITFLQSLKSMQGIEVNKEELEVLHEQMNKITRKEWSESPKEVLLNLSKESSKSSDNSVEDFITTLNDSNISGVIDLQVSFLGEKYDSLYIEENNVPLCEGEDRKKPHLFIKVQQGKGEVFYKYDYAKSIYVLDDSGLTKDHPSLKKVEVLSYSSFSQKDGKIVESQSSVTADYDQLLSGTQRILAIENGKSQEIVGELRRFDVKHIHENDLDKLESLLSKLEDGKRLGNSATKFVAKQLALLDFHREDEMLKSEFYHADAGIMNDFQWATKTVLKDLTKGNVNHGEETSNPHPEAFTFDNHAVFLPDGTVRTLRGEQEVCDFINQQRQLGYLLPINPKWGWVVDENGDLTIPNIKFDFNKVEENLNKLANNLQNQGCDLITKDNRSPDEVVGNFRIDNNPLNKEKNPLVEEYNQEKEIYDSYLMIVRYESSMKVDYGEVADHHQSPNDRSRMDKVNDKGIKSLKAETKKELEELHKKRFNYLKTKYKESNKQFRDHHEEKLSLVANEDAGLSKVNDRELSTGSTVEGSSRRIPSTIFKLIKCLNLKKPNTEISH
ncbi:MAG: hypothetical protein ACJA0S_001166 [Rickettsiales bacterium]|jgi:hypothetical protein